MNNKPLAIGIIFLFVFSSVGSIGLEIKDADIPPVEPVNSPTNHAWPQQGYNSQHLGRSPYSTADNPGIEKWRFATDNWCGGSPSIGTDGIIYFGENDFYLYAVYPNGTLKWKFYANGVIGDYGSTPAIANDGTIYICVKYGGFIQAINPDGTEKWTHSAPDIDTSVTIGEDGMIYYGHHGGLDARFPMVP